MAAPAAELLEKLNGYGEAVTFLETACRCSVI